MTHLHEGAAHAMNCRIRIYMVTIALLLCMPPFLAGNLAAISMTVTGTWSENIDVFDLQGGAGTDLVSTYESASNACVIDVTGAAKKDWEVYVNRVDTLWDANLHLYCRRTSDGIGDGPISGGETYQEITDVGQFLFTSGTFDRTGVEVQYQLTGVSVLVVPNTYITDIVYTVIKY